MDCLGPVDISTCFGLVRSMCALDLSQGVSVDNGFQQSGTLTGCFYNSCNRCDCRMAILMMSFLLALLNVQSAKSHRIFRTNVA